MQYKKFGSRYVVRIDKGEELIETLKEFCNKEGIKLGSVTGIGATNKVTIGLFDPDTKEYHSTELNGNFEMAPLAGNISTMKGETYIHCHVNLCDKDRKSYGGHLNRAIISATCEIIIDTSDGVVDRKFSEEIGLNLLHYSKE
jgi:predicted DNA-binding protein with PD1-like motif